MKVKTPKSKLKLPKASQTTRPVSGDRLLVLFKDRKTLALLCDALLVEYKVDHVGFPMMETMNGIIEALIHQIRGRDHSIRVLLDRLLAEIKGSLKSGHTPLTSQSEFMNFKLFEGGDE